MDVEEDAFAAKRDDEECPICLTALKRGELGVCVTDCNHIFHTRCLCTAMRNATTCPVCRQTLCTPTAESTHHEQRFAERYESLSDVLVRLVDEVRDLRSVRSFAVPRYAWGIHPRASLVSVTLDDDIGARTRPMLVATSIETTVPPSRPALVPPRTRRRRILPPNSMRLPQFFDNEDE